MADPPGGRKKRTADKLAATDDKKQLTEPYAIPQWFRERCVTELSDLTPILFLANTDNAHIGQHAHKDDNNIEHNQTGINDAAEVLRVLGQPSVEVTAAYQPGITGKATYMNDTTLLPSVHQGTTKTTNEIELELLRSIYDIVSPTLMIDGSAAGITQPTALVLGIESAKYMDYADTVVTMLANLLRARVIACDPEDLEDLAMSFHAEQAVFKEDLRKRTNKKELDKELATKDTSKKTTDESIAVNPVVEAKQDVVMGEADTAANDEVVSGTTMTIPNAKRDQQITPGQVMQAALAPDAKDGEMGYKTEVDKALREKPSDDALKTNKRRASTDHAEALKERKRMRDGLAELTHHLVALADSMPGADVPTSSAWTTDDGTDMESTLGGEDDTIPDLGTASPEQTSVLEITLATGSQGAEKDSDVALAANNGDDSKLPPPFVIEVPRLFPHVLPMDDRGDDERAAKTEWCHYYTEAERNNPYAMTARYMARGTTTDESYRGVMGYPYGSVQQPRGSLRDRIKARSMLSWKDLILHQLPSASTSFQTFERQPPVIIHIRNADCLINQNLPGNIFKMLNRLVLDCRALRQKVVVIVSIKELRKNGPHAKRCRDPSCESCEDTDDLPTFFKASFYNSRRGGDSRVSGDSGHIPHALAKAMHLTDASYISLKQWSSWSTQPKEDCDLNIAIRRMKRFLRHISPEHADNPLFSIDADWSTSDRVMRALALPDWDMHKIRQAASMATSVALAQFRAVMFDDIVMAVSQIVANFAGSEELATKQKQKSGQAVLTPQQETSRKDFDDKVARIRKTCDEHERRILDTVLKPYTIKTTYEDVILDDDTKHAVKQLISLYKVKSTCKSEKLLKMLNINGAMFYGPPGTGKTHLCRAMANDHNACMLAIDPAVVRNKWVGGNEALVKATFTVATKLSPCIIFIDEADALFGRRQSDDQSWERASLDIFLQMMDGITSDKKAPFVVVATNRPADLDEAFLRRLPHKVMFKLPSEEQRHKILDLCIGKEDIDGSVDTAGLAKQTDGFSGSDLKTLCGQAVLAWATAKEVNSISNDAELQIVLTAEHFKTALKRTHPSVSRQAIREIESWAEEAMGGESVEMRAMYT